MFFSLIPCLMYNKYFLTLYIVSLYIGRLCVVFHSRGFSSCLLCLTIYSLWPLPLHQAIPISLHVFTTILVSHWSVSKCNAVDDLLTSTMHLFVQYTHLQLCPPTCPHTLLLWHSKEKTNMDEGVNISKRWLNNKKKVAETWGLVSVWDGLMQLLYRKGLRLCWCSTGP